MNESYRVLVPVPKHIFNDDYPALPKGFGERLRKARMDAGLQIKEFAEKLGVTEDTVINWEVRGMRPLRRKTKRAVTNFIGLNNG
jgi:ribosome-binding protein aMBF1 (putative translation factor)